MSYFDADSVFNVPLETKELVGRDNDAKNLKRILKSVSRPTFQITGDHGVGKSALIRRVAHEIKTRAPTISIVYVDCRPVLRAGVESVKSREGLVRDLAAVSGGLKGFDEWGREPALLRRFHNGRWIVILDSFESAVGSDAEEFARMIGLRGQTTLVLVTTRKVDWAMESHELLPLPDEYIQVLIERGVGAHAVPVSDIEALTAAARGFPELALRGAQLYSTGLGVQEVSAVLRRDLVGYYEYELGEITESDLLTRVVSLAALVAVPMRADRIAEILHENAEDIAQSVLQLRDYGLFEFVQDCYRPKDLLLSAIEIDQIDISVIEIWFDWINTHLPSESTISWSLDHVQRCNEISDFFRAFLRIDALLSDLSHPELQRKYALIASSLSGWLYSQGYWLELDLLSDNIKNTLWQLGRARPIICLYLIWQLKALLKREQFGQASSAVEEILQRTEDLDQDEQQLLSLATHVCILQLRHSSSQSNSNSHNTLTAAGLLLPSTEEVIRSEFALMELREEELVCMSRNRRGVIALEESKFALAEKLFLSVICLSKQSNASWATEIKAIAQGNLGILYNKQRNWSEALSVLEPALNGTVQETERLIILAEMTQANYFLKKHWTAWQTWRRAITLADRLGLQRPTLESEPGWKYPMAPLCNLLLGARV